MSKTSRMVACLALASGLVASTPSAQGISASADLAVTGAVVGGETNVPSYHLVAFTFTLKNRGPSAITSSADLNYTVVHNGTVVDQLCIASDRRSIDPDSPYCETGGLRPGQSNAMTLIVQPDDVTGVPLRVRVCSSNETGVPDPVSSNNCVTESVMIQ